MGFKTPLHALHVEAGAKIVDFGGWDMPLHYGSQIDEHHAVRGHAGVFDVSHMGVVDVCGVRARDFLSRVLANNPDKLRRAGKAFYTCMLDERGGIIDDLIVYFLDDDWFRIVVNAGTRDADLAWLHRHAGAFDVDVVPREDLAMLAVQGPQARELAAPLVEVGADAALALKPFNATLANEWMVARTGYTGEDGFEIVLPAAEIAALWRALASNGVAPAGLGARDTLRLEAGMNLYGQDMDTSVTPLECGLAWTVALEPADRDFIGRAAVEGVEPAVRFTGLVLDGRGVMRPQQVVHTDAGDGEITSGSFSPTLGRSIALARIPVGAGDRVEVEIRGRRLPAHCVKPPFVRHGKAIVDLD